MKIARVRPTILSVALPDSIADELEGLSKAFDVPVAAVMREGRVRAARAEGPAVALQRVLQHRNAPRRDVRLHHFVDKDLCSSTSTDFQTCGAGSRGGLVHGAGMRQLGRLSFRLR